MGAHQTTQRDPSHQLNVRLLRYRRSPDREDPALLAQDLLAHGRALDAIELTDIALRRDPGDADLELLRARALLAAGHVQHGERELIRVAKATPDWAAPFSALTRLLSSRGDQDRALKIATRARSLGAEDTMVVRLAKEQESALRLDARIARFERNADLEEPVMLARALLAADRKDDALHVLRLALRRDESDPDTLAALAQIERAEGHKDEAVALYRRAREAAPGWDTAERALLSLVGVESPVASVAARAETFDDEPSVIVEPAIYAEAARMPAIDLDRAVDELVASTTARRDETLPYVPTLDHDTEAGAPASEATLVGAPAVARSVAARTRTEEPIALTTPKRTSGGWPQRLVKRKAEPTERPYVRVLAGDRRTVARA